MKTLSALFPRWKHGRTPLRRPALAFALAAAMLMAVAPLQAGENNGTEAKRPTLADMREIQNKVMKLLERAAPCTVNVDGASGVIVGEEGLVLTVAHVGRHANRPVKIVFPDGKKVAGKTLGNNSKVDAGMVKITEEGPWPHVDMGDSDALKPGDWCVALGYPVSYNEGEPPAVRLGRVLAIHPHAIVTDCTIMGGDSGGPLFNLNGEVIGISSRASGPTTANIHVPVREFADAWDRFVKGDDWYGCRHDEEGEHAYAFLGIAPATHMRTAAVEKVIEGSAAESAGLRAGDVITEADGQAVQTYGQLLPIIFRKDPGDKIVLRVRRGKEVLSVNAKLGKNPK